MTILLLLACVSALGQNPQVDARPNPAFPTVTFSWARWGGIPPEYSLSIASGGNATYQSMPRSVARTGSPYTVEFFVSRKTRDKIFDLVQKLSFLAIPSEDGRLSASKESVKTISFRQEDTHHQIIYQKTHNAQVRELASIFESISRTLEFGRRLSDLHQRHRAELDSQLTRMQSLVLKGRLPELQAIANVLQAIASDPALNDKVSEQAQAILKTPGSHRVSVQLH